jgi:hypothetical protein
VDRRPLHHLQVHTHTPFFPFPPPLYNSTTQCSTRYPRHRGGSGWP